MKFRYFIGQDQYLAFDRDPNVSLKYKYLSINPNGQIWAHIEFPCWDPKTESFVIDTPASSEHVQTTVYFDGEKQSRIDPELASVTVVEIKRDRYITEQVGSALRRNRKALERGVLRTSMLDSLMDLENSGDPKFLEFNQCNTTGAILGDISSHLVGSWHLKALLANARALERERFQA